MSDVRLTGSNAELGTAQLPDGMRVYAVGDIHGCLATLDLLWQEIEQDLEKAPPADHRTIFLGDYVDRGPGSAGVLDWLITAQQRDNRLVTLRGNHDQLLYDFLTNPLGNRIDIDLWLTHGGQETLESYAIAPVAPHQADADIVRCSAELAEAIPDQHRRFLEQAAFSHEIGDFFFVHAGIDPKNKLHQQLPEQLIWIREPFLSHHGLFEKVIVHGHTPVPEPDARRNRIAVDTGAVFGGALTAAVLEKTSVRFLSVPTASQDVRAKR